MRKSRFTESQIVSILRQGEAGVPIAEILRQHNISKATYFQWRAKYAGASVDELKRLINPRNVPEFQAVAPTGVGVFDTLKAVAKLVLTELKKGG